MAKKETKKKLKKQKGKAGATSAPSTAASSTAAPNAGAAAMNANMEIDRSKLTAEQMTQVQIEEAIKESQDPSSKLKKLRSPLSVRGCLLNIVVLIILTVAIVILCCYLMLDRETFNLWVVLKDIFDKMGVTHVVEVVIDWFKSIFS